MAIPYEITSRAYLTRAMARLASGSNEELFYAAFELRCGVEARMQEYLEASKVVKKKIKQGWSIPQLTKAGAKAYLHLPQIQRIEVERDGQTQAVFYYTPVSPVLLDGAAKLGNYLHALQTSPNTADWWQTLRGLLDTLAHQLQLANAGTLLGPVLLKPGSAEMFLSTEIVDKRDPKEFAEAVGKPGAVVIMNVSYMDALPTHIEKEALVWRPQTCGRG